METNDEILREALSLAYSLMTLGLVVLTIQVAFLWAFSGGNCKVQAIIWPLLSGMFLYPPTHILFVAGISSYSLKLSAILAIPLLVTNLILLGRQPYRNFEMIRAEYAKLAQYAKKNMEGESKPLVSYEKRMLVILAIIVPLIPYLAVSTYLGIRFQEEIFVFVRHYLGG